MKKMILTLLVGLMVLSSYAQELPRPSPWGKSSQVVGVTEVSVEYYRPGVKNRTIFGGLVPYGELWRFGANGATIFTTADELHFGDHKLAPGSYAVFAIPNENGTWEIIFNTDTEQGGTTDYTAEKDVFRVQAKAQVGAFTETFTITFDDVKTNSANMVVLWENLRVNIPFEVNTNQLAMRNIDEAIAKGEDLSSVYGNAANYYFSTMGDYDKALSVVEESIKLGEDFRNLFLKARILEVQNKNEEAIKLATKALELAEEAGSNGYANFISGTLAAWKEK